MYTSLHVWSTIQYPLASLLACLLGGIARREMKWMEMEWNGERSIARHS